MPRLKFQQNIGQLEKKRGGYFYLKIDKSTVEKFEKKRATRFICEIDKVVQYSCGLNHYGDGSFFIIVATKWMKKLKKEVGDKVSFEIYEDPNQLGVEIPEALLVLLEQDENANSIFEKITDGKKRSLIYSIKSTKNIDLQIERSLAFLEKEAEKLKK